MTECTYRQLLNYENEWYLWLFYVVCQASTNSHEDNRQRYMCACHTWSYYSCLQNESRSCGDCSTILECVHVSLCYLFKPYRCVSAHAHLHNCYGDGCNSVFPPFPVLAVKRPPMITTQPESVTVFSVEDLVMSCEASGNPSPMLVSKHTHIHTNKSMLYESQRRRATCYLFRQLSTVTFPLLVQLTSTY